MFLEIYPKKLIMVLIESPLISKIDSFIPSHAQTKLKNKVIVTFFYEA